MGLSFIHQLSQCVPLERGSYHLCISIKEPLVPEFFLEDMDSNTGVQCIENYGTCHSLPPLEIVESILTVVKQSSGSHHNEIQ